MDHTSVISTSIEILWVGHSIRIRLLSSFDAVTWALTSYEDITSSNEEVKHV
jgi:hypothetical protein